MVTSLESIVTEQNGIIKFMSPEQQRIAIAEACGWTIHRTQAEIFSNCGHRFSAPLGSSVFTGRHALPSYLDDLNAMHEAEEALTPEQEAEYVTTLCLEVQPEPRLYHATASQRAEAFLKTIGKWQWMIDDK